VQSRLGRYTPSPAASTLSWQHYETLFGAIMFTLLFPIIYLHAMDVSVIHPISVLSIP